MSDERIRRFERLARGGDVAALGQLLRERLRTGDLSQERLELAAYVNHPGALAALGVDPNTEPSDLRKWLRSLQRWGRPVVVRALIVAARNAQPAPTPSSNQSLLIAAAAWAECPCEEHAREAYEGCGHAEQKGDPYESFASSAALHVARATYVAGLNHGPAGVSSLLTLAGIILKEVKEAGRTHEQLREAIEVDLGDWALRSLRASRPPVC